MQVGAELGKRRANRGETDKQRCTVTPNSVKAPMSPPEVKNMVRQQRVWRTGMVSAGEGLLHRCEKQTLDHQYLQVKKLGSSGTCSKIHKVVRTGRSLETASQIRWPISELQAQSETVSKIR